MPDENRDEGQSSDENTNYEENEIIEDHKIEKIRSGSQNS